jgi:AcrR family transcriptional regulator
MSAADRRSAILRCAMEAFATRGYHGTSIDDIASAAGISKALIYEHFPSKQALHAEVISVQADALFARMAQAADAALAPDERLRGGIDAFLGFVECNREAWRALFRDAADPHLGEVVDRLQRRATDAIAEMMVPGAAAPLHDEVEIVAQMLSGAVQALANWWYEHQDRTRAELVDRAMGFAWLGLERLSATAERPRPAGAP